MTHETVEIGLPTASPYTATPVPYCNRSHDTGRFDRALLINRGKPWENSFTGRRKGDGTILAFKLDLNLELTGTSSRNISTSVRLYLDKLMSATLHGDAIIYVWRHQLKFNLVPNTHSSGSSKSYPNMGSRYIIPCKEWFGNWHYITRQENRHLSDPTPVLQSFPLSLRLDAIRSKQ